MVLFVETGDKDTGDTAGPLELSLFGNVSGSPVLVYQTVLAQMGNQPPAERNGQYLARLPINSVTPFAPAHLQAAQIANRSEDAWNARRVFVFGLNAFGTRGRTLGYIDQGDTWVSLDPADTTVAARALMTVSFALDA